MTGNIDASVADTMNQFLDELKTVLIEELTEARKLAGRIGSNKVGQAHVNAKIILLEKLVGFVIKSRKQGSIDMKELKLQLGETGSLDELMTNQRGGIVEPAIMEIAQKLKPGQYEAIDAKAITWGHFAGRVYRMRDQGKLSIEYGPLKRKDKFYLVRYTAEVAKELEAKRGKKKNKTGAAV